MGGSALCTTQFIRRKSANSFSKTKERKFPFSSATHDLLLLLLDAKHNESVESSAVVSDRFFCFARIIAYERQLTTATKTR